MKKQDLESYLSASRRIGVGDARRSGVGKGGCEVICADSSEILSNGGLGKFDCVITSPPYFWQRDYGHSCQMGHESSIDEYVEKLAQTIEKTRSHLKKGGLLFLVIGDTYYSGRGRPKGQDPKQPERIFARSRLRLVDQSGLGLPRKSLIGIPWRVALRLQALGWRLRSEIIWKKPGALAEANVSDRPWRSHEHVFMFSLSEKYFFSGDDLLREGDVWEIKTARSSRKYPHGAAFPEALVERCLRIGCPPRGRVLDPFLGSGTTLVAAQKLGLKGLGIDINPDYCNLAMRRLREQMQSQ